MDGNRPWRHRAQKLQRLLVGANVRAKHFIAHRHQEEIHFMSWWVAGAGHCPDARVYALFLQPAVLHLKWHGSSK